MVVYFGQNDINHVADITTSLRALESNLDRLIAAGATAQGRRLLLVLVHDVQRNPFAKSYVVGRYNTWVTGVARIAAARARVLMIDLTTTPTPPVPRPRPSTPMARTSAAGVTS
jgi:hypothetical protein